MLTDGSGLPLVVAVSTANLHDSQVLIPLVSSIPAIRSRCGPRRRRPDTLRADKAYDQPDLRRFLRRRRISVRIARRGVESAERLAGTGGKWREPWPGWVDTAGRRRHRVASARAD